LEVSGAVRPIYGSLGVKRLISFQYLVSTLRGVVPCVNHLLLKTLHGVVKRLYPIASRANC